MYVVWFWRDNELERVNCGKNSDWAWSIVASYIEEPCYFPWVEYTARRKV